MLSTKIDSTISTLYQEFTFNDMPAAIAQLRDDVAVLKKILLEKNSSATSTEDPWFDLDALCEYDPEKRAKPTIYGMVSRNDIPHYKRGKKLYCLKSEIDAWLKQGRKKTVSEIEAEADAYINNRKGKN